MLRKGEKRRKISEEEKEEEMRNRRGKTYKLHCYTS